MIVGLHITLALKIPEMKIEEAEAKLLANAIADVLQYYPTIKSFLEGKAAAHVALMMAVIQVYGTRLIAFNLRVRNENKQPPDNVTIFNPAGLKQS
jgi:hypothetical protein